jgi:hypothetical protein
MFIVTWLFDKLGYMPKLDIQVGFENKSWLFPSEVEIKSLAEKPVPIKKPVAKNPAVTTKTTQNRKKK